MTRKKIVDEFDNDEPIEMMTIAKLAMKYAEALKKIKSLKNEIGWLRAKLKESKRR